MTRQSITFSKKNADWLAEKSSCGEYASKSEVVNSLIREKRRQEAHHAWLNEELEKGYRSGLIEPMTKEELLESIKRDVRDA